MQKGVERPSIRTIPRSEVKEELRRQKDVKKGGVKKKEGKTRSPGKSAGRGEETLHRIEKA